MFMAGTDSVWILTTTHHTHHQKDEMARKRKELLEKRSGCEGRDKEVLGTGLCERHTNSHLMSLTIALPPTQVYDGRGNETIPKDTYIELHHCICKALRFL